MRKKKTNKTKTITKTKTLPTAFEDFEQPKIPTCPTCSSNKQVIKHGIRKIKNEQIQNYFCKACKKKFNIRSIKHTPYPTQIILRSITYYNLGHTLQQTSKTMQRIYKIKIPISTIGTWIKHYEDDLSFIRLRKNYQIDPNTVIHSKKFHHQQVYEFKLPEGHPSGSKNPRKSRRGERSEQVPFMAQVFPGLFSKGL